MKIFVATKETQGQRANDFCHADEGETVTFGVLTCTGETADGNCGCVRSLCGLRTSKATTTMKVVEWEGNFRDLEFIIARSLQKGGWFNPEYAQVVPDGISTIMATSIAENAACFPVGTVVEYRDGQFLARQAKTQEVQA